MHFVDEIEENLFVCMVIEPLQKPLNKQIFHKKAVEKVLVDIYNSFLLFHKDLSSCIRQADNKFDQFLQNYLTQNSQDNKLCLIDYIYQGLKYFNIEKKTFLSLKYLLEIIQQESEQKIHSMYNKFIKEYSSRDILSTVLWTSTSADSSTLFSNPLIPRNDPL